MKQTKPDIQTTALTVRRTQEGFELRTAYSFTGPAPTPAKRRDAALAMLSEVHAAASKTNAVDGGFSVSGKQLTGVGSLVIDRGAK